MSLRLGILDRGHRVGTKLLFTMIRVVSRQPVPEALKLVMYRAGFYGTPMQKVTQAAMRGPSAWSIGDRELMAAFVSQLNECEYCVKTHSEVATRAYDDRAKVMATLTDVETAAIEEPLRATLRMLRKLTIEHTVGANDMQALLTAGVSREHIEDALAVYFAFSTMNRLAGAFNFAIGTPAAFASGAQYLHSRGYR
jgi:uncharacterized peroxidase-related enzyme